MPFEKVAGTSGVFDDKQTGSRVWLSGSHQGLRIAVRPTLTAAVCYVPLSTLQDLLEASGMTILPSPPR